jgi:2Fe-2S ferredoxin
MSGEIAIVLVTAAEDAVELSARPGETLMSVATAAAHPGILAECGGGMSCGTCHVIVDDAWADAVGRAEGEEAGMLEFLDTATPTSRLSCQVELHDGLDGMRARTPAEQSGI